MGCERKDIRERQQELGDIWEVIKFFFWQEKAMGRETTQPSTYNLYDL